MNAIHSLPSARDYCVLVWRQIHILTTTRDASYFFLSNSLTAVFEASVCLLRWIAFAGRVALSESLAGGTGMSFALAENVAAALIADSRVPEVRSEVSRRLGGDGETWTFVFRGKPGSVFLEVPGVSLRYVRSTTPDQDVRAWIKHRGAPIGWKTAVLLLRNDLTIEQDCRQVFTCEEDPFCDVLPPVSLPAWQKKGIDLSPVKVAKPLPPRQAKRSAWDPEIRKSSKGRYG